jgi:hypothetical protein
MDQWLRFSLIAGILTSGLWYIVAFTNPLQLFNPWLGWMPVVIILVFMGIWGFVYGQDYVEFRPLVSVLFKMYLVAMGLFYVADFVMYQGWIEDLGKIRLDESIRRLNENVGILGEENARELEKRWREEGIDYRVSALFMNFARSLMGGFLGAALLTFSILRNNKS